jgi:hypothetical protein
MIFWDEFENLDSSIPAFPVPYSLSHVATGAGEEQLSHTSQRHSTVEVNRPGADAHSLDAQLSFANRRRPAEAKLIIVGRSF